jgi:hypothetical protein
MTDKPVSHAIERGSDFLFANRRFCGNEPRLWEDFDLLLGPSDEWVTAYAACAELRRQDISCRRIYQNSYTSGWAEGLFSEPPLLLAASRADSRNLNALAYPLVDVDTHAVAQLHHYSEALHREFVRMPLSFAADHKIVGVTVFGCGISFDGEGSAL